MPVLASHLARTIPHGARVLDIGAGDGRIDSLILAARSDVTICGVDVGQRDHTHIAVSAFDGTTLPFADQSFDAAMLIDVLHHTDDPQVLLREAARVAKLVILKDHTRDGFLAGIRLRCMDYVGNRYTNVSLPNNYYTRERWRDVFARLRLREIESTVDLGIYPWPINAVFERGLNFLCVLQSDATKRF
jgi:SAM-dependent methyltransferase